MNRPAEQGAMLRAVHVEPSLPRERQIGALLIDSGKLTVRDAERVLVLQRESGIRFGEAAVKLGLVSEAEIKAVLAQQFSYPIATPGETDLDGELVAAFDPYSKPVELLRGLRTQLLIRWLAPEIGHKIVAITSPARGEGKTFIASNLAIVFSQLGERTLLIDGNLRNPRIHALFRLDNRIGLSTILSGKDEDAVHKCRGMAELSVLPAGPVPPNPQELLTRSAFKEQLERFSSEFDVVIIDTPAASTCADAQAIALRSGGAVVVARKDLTQIDALRDAAQQLRTASIDPIGIVFNEF